MIKFTYDKTGIKLIKTEDLVPECGVDFCDRCGDCLACYFEDDCLDDKWRAHYWVEYENL